MAAHLAATRATSVLAAEHARVAELTAARAAVDAAVARRRVAMAAADARAFQAQMGATGRRGRRSSRPARACHARAGHRRVRERGARARVTEARPYSTRDPLEIPDAQPPESGSEESSDGEQEDDASERGDGVYMFRASNGVLWQRSPQRGWSAVRYSERERRAHNMPIESRRLRQRVRLAEQHLASLSLAEQDRAMERVNRNDPRAITLVTVHSLGARQAHEDEPSVEEREVFRALRDDVALDTAEEEEEAVTAREIGEVPTREHNLWVIMISLPGCSRARPRRASTGTAATCAPPFTRRPTSSASGGRASRRSWRSSRGSRRPTRRPGTRRATRAAQRHPDHPAAPPSSTNPEYVRHVHDRVTDVIARSSGHSDFEATEAEVELLGRRAEEVVRRRATGQAFGRALRRASTRTSRTTARGSTSCSRATWVRRAGTRRPSSPRAWSRARRTRRA